MKDKIVLLDEDISSLEVDAVICQANTDLEMGDEISSRLLRQGGDEIQNECNSFENLEKGQSVITRGGKLPAKNIIHAIIYNVGEEDEIEEEILMSAIRHALQIVKEKGFKSIALPLFGNGKTGIPIKRAAELILAEVKKHLEGENELENIYFVAHTQTIYDAFEEAYKQL